MMTLTARKHAPERLEKKLELTGLLSGHDGNLRRITRGSLTRQAGKLQQLLRLGVIDPCPVFLIFWEKNAETFPDEGCLTMECLRLETEFRGG